MCEGLRDGWRFCCDASVPVVPPVPLVPVVPPVPVVPALHPQPSWVKSPRMRSAVWLMSHPAGFIPTINPEPLPRSSALISVRTVSRCSGNHLLAT